MSQVLNRANIEAIVRGDHGDPFAVLGMHEADGGLEVRAFLPGASAVTVLDAATGQAVADLPRVHRDGLFAGPVGRRKRRFRHRLRVRWDGTEGEIEDPYRYPPLLGELDVHLLGEGTHLRPQEKLGAHLCEIDGAPGTGFAVWAPNARRVSVVGPFNQWDGRRHAMRLRRDCGVWEIFLPGVGEGELYKFEILGHDGALHLKADPYAFRAEPPPRTASVVAGPARHVWTDDAWLASRTEAQAADRPMTVYEVHAGSWRRRAEEGDRPLTYRELADELVPYVRDMGFTHIEMMPLTEHPFTGSWGYQPTGLFAPTSRFGTPDDLRALIDACHAAGLGLLLDWVPAHFPSDAHGLAQFDGTHLFEHADPRLGRHMDWDTLIYNFGRREVANFLIASALHWLEDFHVDGLRVDAVASMLYLDYSRKAGQWLPNRYGGNENLEAIDFLKRMNETCYGEAEGITTLAEESTAWPMVSRPTFLGGLGFGYKWNMGWMHDTLAYMSEDPIHRRYHHDKMSFGLVYAFTENFVLPLSHDEVVHGKGALLSKMPGDRWRRFANLRAYYTFMYTHPGKKLLFMGGEFAQDREWSHDRSLDWHLLDDPMHRGIQTLVKDLNHLYRSSPALHRRDCDPAGFAWIDCNDSENSVYSYLRFGASEDDLMVVVCNFTPVVRQDYRVGVPHPGRYRELFNSDAAHYGGSDVGNWGEVEATATPWQGRPASLSLTLPPLAGLILAPVSDRS